MEKLVKGFGINDSGYRTSIKTDYYVNGKRKYNTVWKCPYYAKWLGMLYRTCAEAYQKDKPTYRDKYVTSDWKYFSKFKAWMETQHWEECLELDKDILIAGNKEYGPDSCCFVPRYINLALSMGSTSDSSLPVGVSLATRYVRKDGSSLGDQYMARVNDSSSKTLVLGKFDNPEAAHKAWQEAKVVCLEELLTRYATEKFFDTKVAEAINARIWKIRLEAATGLETKII